MGDPDHSIHLKTEHMDDSSQAGGIACAEDYHHVVPQGWSWPPALLPLAMAHHLYNEVVLLQ